MPAKRPTGARSETVQCEFCGEYYAVTYKRCPFCDGKPGHRRAEEYDDEPTRIFRRPQVGEEAPEEIPVRRSRQTEEDEYEPAPPRRRSTRDEYEPDDEYEDGYDDDEEADYDDPPRRSDGGRRLITNERGGGYRRRGPSILQVIVGILSVALIASAVYIVVLLVGSLLGKDQSNPPATNSPTASVTPAPSNTSTPSPSPTESDEPAVTDEPTDPSATIPAGQTATAFTLTDRAGVRKQDITLSDQYPDFKFVVAFSPSGSTGTITWSSSKPEVVSVDQSGKVVGVSKGIATITATMAGGYEQQCMVRSSVTSSGSGSAQPSTSPSTAPSASPSSSPSSGGALSFNVYNKDEFTLTGAGDSWNLKVNNAVGTPAWSVKDASIATVDQNGKVTAVSKGSTTITATVDGQTLTCLVHVNIP